MPKFPVFPLEASIGRLVYLTAMFLKAHLHRSFVNNGFNITPENWAVLNRLWEEDGLPQSELSYRALKDRHNIARILNVLEKKHLITRKPDSTDRRKYNIFLTSKGKSYKAKLIPITSGHLEKSFRGLNERDIGELRRILGKVLTNLEVNLNKKKASSS